MVTKNVGKTDQIIRLVAAVILIILYFSETVTGAVGQIILVVGLVLFLTALIRFCPAYSLIKKSTCCGTCQTKDSDKN